MPFPDCGFQAAFPSGPILGKEGQDPERQALSGIGNLNERLLVLSKNQGLSELSESSDDPGLRNQGRAAAKNPHGPVKFLYRTISPVLTIGGKLQQHKRLKN